MNDTHCHVPRRHTPFSRQFRRITPLTLCAALLLLLSALASAPARADAPRTTLPGMSVPREAATARLVGRLPAAQTLRLTFVLPLRNQADLADLQRRLYDKTDPLYQHFLKRGEFAERFGPSLAEVDFVSRYAAAHGLTLQDATPSHTLVHVTGPASAVETTFGVHLNNYVDATGHPFYAPDAAPTVTADLAVHVVGVLGLDTATVPRHSPLHVKTPEEIQASPLVGEASVSSSNSAGLTPDDIYRVYNVPTGTGYDGSGQTLALFEHATYTAGDIPAYQNAFGLPYTSVVPVGVDGFDTSAPTTYQDGSDEVTLDIDVMLALAPNASRILVYEGSGSDTGAIYQKIADDDAASVVSTSWYNTSDDTGGSTLATAEETAFLQMEMQGQSMFSASGDGGAYADQDALGPNPTLSVEDPGSQQYLTSVGGTSLQDTATEQYVSESSWADLNDNHLHSKIVNGMKVFDGYGTGGGGGISGYWPLPDYQADAFTSSSNPQGSMTKRNVPDVSLYGDYDEGGYCIYFTDRDMNNNPLPGFYGYNGTSAASPLWAAFTALVNQQRALNGRSSIGFLNPYVYAILGNDTAYATDFHDIDDGSDNLFYNAVSGYDNSTGIGSFIGTSLLGDLSGTGVSLAGNDDFESPIVVAASYGSPGTSGSNNLGTTSEPGEPLNTSGSGGHTVWWTWTATASGPVTIDTFSSSFDTTLGVYTGSSVGGLTLIADDDDSASTRQSIVTFNAVGGTQYRISVDGFLNAEGTVVLHITPGSPFPVITGFSPSSAPAGAVVTISGQHFLGTDSVAFNGVDASFSDTDTTISATVPATTSGPITVTTATGTATSATFTVIPVPTITSFTPASGLVNTSVTITGTGFTYATGLQFNGVNAPYTINSDTQITATVPQGAATGPITVTNPAGTATSSSFMVATVPVITSFTPASGLIGAAVTITGSGFTGAVNVAFSTTNNGYTGGAYTVNSDTQITVTVPQRAITGPIEVVTNFGTAQSSANFTITMLTPTITSFTPTSGISGTTVTITGTHFTAASNVVFHDTDAAYTVNSDTQITATVPVGATTGPIEVVNNGGSVFSSANFTVTYPAPTITSFTPAAGNSGTVVTITGTHFTGAGNVQFNGTDAAYTVNSDTQITATVPRGATTGPLQVDTNGGSAFGSTNFIVYNPPTIMSFTPTSGPVDTMVTITGTKFEGTNSVKFNGTAATFFVNSDTQIAAYVPTGATTGPITIANPVWTVTGNASFTVIPAPIITSFTPVSGPAGTTVVITGSHFTGASTVDFPASPYGKPASFTVNSDTQITAVVPSGAGTGQISIFGPGGGAQSSGTFTTTTPPVPTITSFAPTSGAIGTVVTITGTGFIAASNVEFDGHDASYTVNSSTQITATVPAGAATGPIEVVTNGGSVFSSTNFTVTYPAPAITSFTPASGPVGTVVTITGTNFTGAGNVQFNGKDAISYTVNSNTQITATVPAGATTGLIQVDTNGGSAFSSANFTVTIPAPTITSFTPTSGPIGTVVTVTGTHFTGASNVQFSGVDSAYTVNSDTSITAAVPTGAATGPIQVVTNGGSVFSSTSFTVTIPAPTVTSFTPMAGPVGTVVTVTGTHLNGVTAVRFHNANATTFSANGAGTQLTVTVPTGAGTGTFTVTTPGGSIKTTGTFTVTVPPTVTSFTPTSGPIGTVVTVTGTNLNGVTAVRFHNANATVFSANAAGTQLTVTVPTGAGTGTFTVTTPAGSVKTTGTFTVTVPPTVTSFTPTSGPIGTVVTVTGANLNGVTAVRFHNANAATFSANAAGTQLTVTVPTGAGTGTFTVTTPGGSVKTTGTFTVN